LCVCLLVKYDRRHASVRLRYSNIPAATNLALALAVFCAIVLKGCRRNSYTAAKMVRRRVVQQSLKAR